MAALPLVGCGDNGGGDDDESTTVTPMTSTNPTSGDEPTGGGDTGETGETGGETGEPQALSYAADIQPIWTMNCVLGCHTPGGTAAANVLLDGDSYANIVNKSGTQLPTMQLITPGDPDNSYLWHKLGDTYTQVGGSGLKMPQGTSGLPQPQLDTIKAWIEGGAQP